MEGYFSIAQIATKVKRSKQAIYKLISNNQELGKILPDNTITIGKGKQYSQAVLTWITEYYERIADSEGESQDAEEETRARADEVEMALLRQEVKHLQEKLETAEKQLEESKAEKAQLHQDYSAVLLLFAQEKAEKQQLLLEVQEKKTIAIQEAEIAEAGEETPEDEKKPEEVNKKPGFFARMFGRGKKGSADK